MGFLSDFFIDKVSPAPVYDGGESYADADKCQFKGLSSLQCSQFIAVLRGVEYDVALMSEFKLVSSEDEDAEEWTVSVPPDMVTLLAAIDEDNVILVAQRFADATQEELGWSVKDFVPVVRDLSNLARKAVAEGKGMFLWNCL